VPPPMPSSFACTIRRKPLSGGSFSSAWR
jgi:hypothetical protein